MPVDLVLTDELAEMFKKRNSICVSLPRKLRRAFRTLYGRGHSHGRIGRRGGSGGAAAVGR
ncbi:MAG: hypothetical protein ACLRSW_13040 [Christensenellaceae bacterium]